MSHFIISSSDPSRLKVFSAVLEFPERQKARRRQRLFHVERTTQARPPSPTLAKEGRGKEGKRGGSVVGLRLRGRKSKAVSL